MFTSKAKILQFEVTALTGFIITAIFLFLYNIVFGLAFLSLPMILLVVGLLYLSPKAIIWTCLVTSFTILGIHRVFHDSIGPVGLIIDALILFLFLSQVFYTKHKPDWSKANNAATWIWLVWFLFCLLELFNPDIASRMAWLYAVRSLSLYWLMMIPVACVVLNRKDFHTFITIWFIFSVIGTLDGLRQLYVGLLPFEHVWLNKGAITTHILHGKLRVFSHYTDAGQFGAAQAQTMVAAAILFLDPRTVFRRRTFYLVVAIITMIGMFISGTRGALGVPAFAVLLFLLISKNWKLILIGALVGFGAFATLKWTSIGHNIYAVQRMRTALNPTEDASFNVRLINQAKFRQILADKPLGGGLGVTLPLGAKFAPHHPLAQIPTDSWFVQVWAETGWIGLTLYLILLFLMMIFGVVKIWRIEDESWRIRLTALLCAVMGMFFASYTNGLVGQIPSSIVTILAISFIFMKVPKNQENS